MIVLVTPFAGVWIEISFTSDTYIHHSVTPFAGVWIEIIYGAIKCTCSVSLPSRECGLKYPMFDSFCTALIVTPFAGVWIEIIVCFTEFATMYVTPFAGVWIEIVSAEC